MKAIQLLAAAGCGLAVAALLNETPGATPAANVVKVTASRTTGERELATFGAGCFWCVEAVFERIEGVTRVTSGYMGGTMENPTYREVCTGATGHAEVVQLEFDPATIRFEKLLEVFWRMHDPTTLNRQGADTGTQYRSVVFFHSGEQQTAAENSRKEKDASGEWSDPIVTEITKASTFYAAEDYHQDYFNQNQGAPYCRAVIWPKLLKLGLKTK